jgi:hypothetical protein
VTHVSEDPRLLGARAVHATECSRKAAGDVPKTGRNFKKDVEFNGTNSISPVESTKVSKNELKTNWKNVLFIRKKPPTNRKSNPKKASLGVWELSAPRPRPVAECGVTEMSG